MTPAEPVDAAAMMDLAIRAARLGGAEISARAGKASGVAYKSTATDPVSDADRASEAAIVDLISRERPTDGLLGEEGAGRRSGTGLRWVVDPLDGTVNYLYGLPHVAVSVACERYQREPDSRAGGPAARRLDADAWQAVAGAVYDPIRDEMFAAARGGGAFLGGERITATAPANLADALIATGLSYSAASRARQAALAAEVAPRARDLRSHGSAALELCWVAAGRCDGYYEDELARWDWAAGALIAGEAGAVVAPLGSGVIVAAATVYPELAAICRRVRAPS